MREYHLKRYHRMRKEAIESLGGKCTVCGTQENLEIDHIDRTQKEVEISRAILSLSRKRFLEELAKCQLLCQEHHGDKTLMDLGKKKAKGTHGTLSAYRYCKCSICVKVHTDWCREYKKRKRVLS